MTIVFRVSANDSTSSISNSPIECLIGCKSIEQIFYTNQGILAKFDDTKTEEIMQVIQVEMGERDMLQELKTMFSQQVEQELLQTVRDFHACKQEEGQSVSSYEYDEFVQNYNMHGMGKTVNELHAMLKLHEQSLPKKDATLNQGNGKSKLAYDPKPKIPPRPKKDNPTKDVICHQCGEVGHWIRNYLVYLTELMKKKKQASSASTLGIFTIELYYFPNKSWVYDTDCGTQICNITQGLRGSKKLKPEALNMYVGNGHRAAVEAIGISRLIDNGFVNCFMNGGISVSKDGLLYFHAIPRDGIYEIDLHCSNSNDSSIYSISNKRAKLNLDSTLFKMAPKPFPHQKERTKDLLGLIHTDDYAFESAARILNMVPTKKVEKTQYEVWHGQALKLSYLKVTQRKQWVTPSITHREVFVAQNAEFFKSSLISQESNRSLEDLEVIQEEDTHHSENTSKRHDEDEQEIDEPQSDVIPVRRSTRTRHDPD
ncbi:hypothetical protein Tco_0210661 [Tanacetum coccineum]